MWEEHFGLRERIFTPAFDQSLPLLPTQLVARQQLLDTLADGHGLVLLVGEAGTGKTRLAVELASHLKDERCVLWMPSRCPSGYRCPVPIPALRSRPALACSRRNRILTCHQHVAAETDGVAGQSATGG
jgi:hypothetical protein